jgi:hypothetical protein
MICRLVSEYLSFFLEIDILGIDDVLDSIWGVLQIATRDTLTASDEISREPYITRVLDISRVVDIARLYDSERLVDVLTIDPWHSRVVYIGRVYLGRETVEHILTVASYVITRIRIRRTRYMIGVVTILHAIVVMEFWQRYRSEQWSELREGISTMDMICTRERISVFLELTSTHDTRMATVARIDTDLSIGSVHREWIPTTYLMDKIRKRFFFMFCFYNSLIRIEFWHSYMISSG